MSNSIMRKIAKFIVEKHIIIMLLFVVLVIYSALSISKVRVNEDITALLPPKTATRRGLTVMENEFTAFASANVMVSNITYEKAAELAENLPENKLNGTEGKRKEDRTVDKRADQTACHNSPSRITLSHRRVDHKVGKLGKEESHDGGNHE